MSRPAPSSHVLLWHPITCFLYRGRNSLWPSLYLSIMSRINIGSDQSHCYDIIAVHSGKHFLKVGVKVRVRMWLWLGLCDVMVFPSLQCDWSLPVLNQDQHQEHQHDDIRLSLHQRSQSKVQVRIMKTVSSQSPRCYEAIYFVANSWARSVNNSLMFISSVWLKETESFKPKKEKRLHRDTDCNNRQVTATFMLAMVKWFSVTQQRKRINHPINNQVIISCYYKKLCKTSIFKMLCVFFRVSSSCETRQRGRRAPSPSANTYKAYFDFCAAVRVL